MFRRFAVLCAVLSIFSCGPGGGTRDAGQFPPLGGGTFGGGFGATGGGSGSTGGGSNNTGGGVATGGGSGSFMCGDLKTNYVLVGTNAVQGLCEVGARTPLVINATGCSTTFQLSIGGAPLNGTCQFSSSGVCMTTVRINGSDQPVTVSLNAGASTGTGSFGSGAMTCTFRVEVDPTLGKSCACANPSSGTQVCMEAGTGCNPGEWCVQEDDRDGAYCSQAPDDCTDPRFEAKTINGIDLCAFKKKYGACEHSAQCESCSSGTPGVSYSAACFNGSCRVRCTSSSANCNCVFTTPVSGDAIGYCSDYTCQ